MLARSSIEKIIPLLRSSARRALRMRLPGYPAPYYTSFLLRDTHTYYTSASGGSTYEKKSDQTRFVYSDIRVGSYRYDQTTNGGISETEDELESSQHVALPIDDTNQYGMSTALWRLTEIKFREALTAYQHKHAKRVSKIDENRSLENFTPAKPTKVLRFESPEKVDVNKWATFCRKASEWMSELPSVFSDQVTFSSEQESKIFVSTENRIIVQHQQIFSVSGSFKRLSSEGSHIEQEFVINATSQSELPNLREFKKLAWEKYERLMELSKAKKIHAFSGPVLLCPGPAGLLLHEAIGHRLEGDRLLSQSEGQTFKGQIGKRILNVDLNIRDNPRLKKFNGKKCLGAYDFDDEGIQSQNALLVENGILKGFLSSRSALTKRGFVPNGHGRNAKHQRPISRMGVLQIDSKKGIPMERLKEMLIREIIKQKKPFGLIIYDTNGGETDTSSYNFQAFSGQIDYAALVYPDGSEEVVRGINIVGTPLQALNSVVAVGDTCELDNGFCGAESGMIPVSTISPALLLKNLELQAKEEELVTQYLLPKPRPQSMKQRRAKRLRSMRKQRCR